MFPTFSKLFSVSGLLIWSLLFSAAHAASEPDTRIANRTIERTVNLRTHSLYAPYIDQDLQNRWWDFGADSYINTNKHVRLTRNRPSQMGWLWSRLPLTAPNYIIEAEFKISGDSTHLYGDGFAMWLTTERTQPGPVFGNKNNFDGLGIIVDTYANSRHGYSFPRVSGFLFDGTTEYNMGNDGDGQAIGACSANVRRTNVATKLKLTYIKDRFLDVKVQYKAWDDWSDCFYAENVTLSSSPFIGFSALTGDVSDAHDIISVTTSSVILSQSSFQNPKQKATIWGTSNPVSTGKGGSWSGFLFKLILLVGVVGGGAYGWNEYQRRKRYGGFGSANFGGGASGGMLGMGGPSRFGGPYANEKRF
ncbi:concanavalin A-like lectin/glucanase [Macrolepiota fuliginosa MF-IS2]|uniref:Concanavalin A-like lectin/glucanase n=1 Tax=Macrolepiota fuliginosa MF-IS2 TaxID=1400762 RepID=A0A9P6C413_9AGAR|nr:concanavalin A-like lectin/glucanase [Macrolepiota fuliginosa MF-IS2]